MGRDIDKLKRQREADRRSLDEILENQRVQQGMLEYLVATMNKLVADSQTRQTGTAPTQQSTGDMDVPAEYAIEPMVLKELYTDSLSAGNFAARLTQRLFPELFGAANLKFQYSWHGGGNKKKSELCPIRKNIIRKYVTYYFPEVTGDTAWKDSVVAKVNELLRRTTREERKRRRLDDVEERDGSTRKRLRDDIQPDNHDNNSDISFGTFVQYMNL
jgi:hypothetical protein